VEEIALHHRCLIAQALAEIAVLRRLVRLDEQRSLESVSLYSAELGGFWVQSNIIVAAR
jgi:hypothetical protein